MGTQFNDNKRPDFAEKEKVFYSIFDPVDTITAELWIAVTHKFDVTALGQPIFASKLQKKSKALGYWVTRYYFLFEDYMGYGSSKNFFKIKKYISLEGLKVCLPNKKKPEEGPWSVYTLGFFRCNKLFMLKVQNEELLNTWLNHLRKRCIMVNLSHFYVMHNMLGKGSYGKVYLIQSKQDNQKYVAKVISKEKIITRLLGLDTLFNEIKTLRKLDHENIVKLKEVFETPSSIYLVIEYVEGEELKSRLQSKIFFSEQECLPIMKNILETVVYIHDKRIVHRDLKLENILILADSPSAIKLIDFGLSVDLNERQEAKKGGTPGYMAPEILNNESSRTVVTTKEDIFSIGCIFYRLLTGKKLFNGSSAKEVFERNQECYINLNHPALGIKSSNARNLLALMLEKDPEKRISAEEALMHPFFTPDKASSFTEFSEISEDIDIAPVCQYSFDMNHIKENNMLTGSKVFDYNGSIYMSPQYPHENGLHYICQSGPLKSPRITINVDFTHTMSIAGTNYAGESSAGSSPNPSRINIDENKSMYISYSCISQNPTQSSKNNLLDVKPNPNYPFNKPSFQNTLGKPVVSTNVKSIRLGSPSKMSWKGFEDFIKDDTSRRSRRKSITNEPIYIRTIGPTDEDKDK